MDKFLSKKMCFQGAFLRIFRIFSLEMWVIPRKAPVLSGILPPDDRYLWGGLPAGVAGGES